MFSKFSPGTYEEIRQIHNKGLAVDGKLYYGKAKVIRGSASTSSIVLVYRGTHEGRLKEETELANAEGNLKTNASDIESSKDDITALDIRLTAAEATLDDSASKCFSIAMAIALG